MVKRIRRRTNPEHLMSPWCLLAWKVIEKGLLDWHVLEGRYKRPSENANEWPRDPLFAKSRRRQELLLFFHSDWFELLCEALPGKLDSAALRRRHKIR